MTFAAAERAYLSPPEPCCDDDDCDGDECERISKQSAEDDMIERADAIRKGEW